MDLWRAQAKKNSKDSEAFRKILRPNAILNKHRTTKGILKQK